MGTASPSVRTLHGAVLGVLAHPPVAVASSKRGAGGHGNLGRRVLTGGSPRESDLPGEAQFGLSLLLHCSS